MSGGITPQDAAAGVPRCKCRTVCGPHHIRHAVCPPCPGHDVLAYIFKHAGVQLQRGILLYGERA